MVSYYGKNGPLIAGVMWVETLLALLFVVARVYTRAILVRGFGWDDTLIVITQILFFGYTIACTVAAVNGMGSHAADLGSTAQVVKAVKWEIASQSFNIAAIATSKNSVAVFLLRIVNERKHVYGLWFCIASTSFVCASCIIFMFTQCTPLESIFNPTIPRTCYVDFTSNAIFSGSYTAMIDFVLAIVPWFILWQLNMKRKERLTVAIGLSLGVFAGICGIIRAIQLQEMRGTSDYTYVTMPLILMGSTELLVCIVCASVPILRPLYKKVVRNGSSSNAYELGNTPSKQLENGSKMDGKSQRYNSRAVSNAYKTEYHDGTSGRTNMSTTVTMGHAHENPSDEEILKGVKERMDILDTRGKEHIIHKTTQVDISYEQT